VAATVGHLTYQAEHSSLASDIVTPPMRPVRKDLVMPSKTVAST